MNLRRIGEVHIFRQPPASEARRLLSESGLPTADLTSEILPHFFGCGPEQAPSGVVGLELLGSDALLRSLAVRENARRRGCGRALVAAAERYAQACGARRVYLLTTGAEKYFEHLGYHVASRDDAPESIRRTRTFSSLCPATATLMAKTLSASRPQATPGSGHL